ncbi:winged helix-turn-helix domain-containing protein [Archaeoglobus veneficus]|uniref:Regulatory protein ArsR n=1 Tax=Archaeoglobus veneficus (strain DSM 11195 / SNP6) TaxID=693661 RepID=F2KRH6_ARCVS|nr:winged helix-turn-helix domain-containing protein [Archaeoglobus veneficus]AEA46741.1 regulatory protein ArsR [Archaeoglobus veneficus SNP6]
MTSKRKFEILLAILKGKKYFGEIQEAIGLKKPIVSEYIRALKEEGLILEHTDPNDRRRRFYELNLTIEGLRTIVRNYPEIIPELQKNDGVVDFLINHHKVTLFREDVREMLKTSPNFFKMLVLGSFDEYIQLLRNFPAVVIDLGETQQFVNYLTALEYMFIISVWNDVVEFGNTLESPKVLKKFYEKQSSARMFNERIMFVMMVVDIIKAIASNERNLAELLGDIEKFEKDLNNLRERAREMDLDEYIRNMGEIYGRLYEKLMLLAREGSIS